MNLFATSELGIVLKNGSFFRPKDEELNTNRLKL